MKNYTLTLKNFPLIYKRFFNIHKNIHIEILAWCKVVVIYIYRKHFISWVNFVFWKIRGRKSIFYVFWPVSVLFCFSIFFSKKFSRNDKQKSTSGRVLLKLKMFPWNFQEFSRKIFSVCKVYILGSDLSEQQSLLWEQRWLA